MWQKEKKDTGIVNLALLLTLTTAPIAANMLLSAPMLAQSTKETPAFELPQTVENGTTLRIDGSTSLIAVNQSLKQSFEQQFAGTKVDLATNGTESALKGVLDGSIDVAALARGLTPEEKAQGLEQVRLHREKIAIIVGEENPFKGSLTDRQFARIFRGRITNWSQIGAPAAKIRFIDRPDTSDTRQTLSSYPVFKAVKFATGSTATQVSEDNTAEIVKQLGKDGISYARANQVLKLTGVRVLQLHETTPDDPKYPFSQPLVYVYKKSPKPSVAAFLGFALASPGQKAIETARVAEALAIAKGETQAPLTATNPASTPEATTSPVAGTAPFTTSAPNTNTFPNASTTNNLTQPGVEASPETPQLDRSLLWWLLLPVGAIGGLLLWFIKRPSATTALDSTPELSEAETKSDVTSTSEPLVEIHDNTTNTILQNNNATVIQSTNSTAIQELDNNPTVIQFTNATTIQEVDNNPTVIQSTAQESDKTNSGNPQITIPPELEQSPWDMEAPAAVVNTSYAQMIEVPKTPTHVEQPTTNVVTQIQETAPAEDNHQQLTEELSQTPAYSDNEETELAPVAIEDTEVADSLPDLPDFHAIFADAADEDATEQTDFQEITDENGQLAAILPTFNDIPEDALNSVADAAEIHENGMLEEGEYLTASSLGTLTGGAVLAGVGAQTWVGSNHIEETVTSQVSATANFPETSLPTASVTTSELEDEEEPSSIVLKSRNAEWAYVSWYISPHDQQKLHIQGISELTLRLYDVTEIDLSYQQPQQVQQYECEPGTSDRYVQIPASDRDYIIDLGYVTGGEWVNIARSASVHVFNSPYTDPLLANLPGLDAASSVVFTPRSPKWAYVSWDISPAHQQLLIEHGITQLALRLYDATNIDLSYQHPQLVQQYEFDEITRDRYVSIPHSDHDYVTEVGYVTTAGDWVTIARSAIVHIFNSSQGDFWFVADSELIIHGATDPDATVTIAGKPVTLKPDGTFHLRVPFSEEVLDYLITVASGEQRKTIHKKFTQENSES
ncbi:hypothetical protein NIES2111_31810 [Nostoc sp. NIES-2111]|nr:hypothetical protein NIES2111_31810 [Nostoc sp. NIES-2111]